MSFSLFHKVRLPVSARFGFAGGKRRPGFLEVSLSGNSGEIFQVADKGLCLVDLSERELRLRHIKERVFLAWLFFQNIFEVFYGFGGFVFLELDTGSEHQGFRVVVVDAEKHLELFVNLRAFLAVKIYLAEAVTGSERIRGASLKIPLNTAIASSLRPIRE